MTTLADVVTKVRSKNAGPFWLTFDIFCAGEAEFGEICAALNTERVAAALQVSSTQLKRFEISDLNVLKFSLPRPQIQGTRHDRDMHGASFANILAELEI
ncbi:DUF4387 family protein [Gymnodinialimonas hymeniacidonis]|uniref:DUF4387 family protein n=1 Tax=Gymnodinialimonas hymeniacidonis TaxID=3126508 RepID=UPI0034C617FC